MVHLPNRQLLFPEVRAYEAFKYLHVGLIGNLKRKSLPAIAQVVGLQYLVDCWDDFYYSSA
jgi:SRSO17 transposase